MKFSSSGYLVKEGLKNIWNNRMMSLASIIVLVSCLIITGAAILLSLNVANLISTIGDDNQINV
ncbi:MAG: ABC transporter permease, partial [Clostridia bacterium]|nr:ABC transporter permease [Clostridia bacterium]